jgi:dihydrolipoamide dehydrogenase
VAVGDDRCVGEHVVLAAVRGRIRRSMSTSAASVQRQALQLDFVPDDVIVLGGGVIGIEFANGQLATLDSGLAPLHGDVAVLISS